MANLQETSTWEAGIYQLETSDPVMGGENGIDNRAPRQLANRTLWLKNELARQIGAVNSGKLGKTENAVSAAKLATARNIAMTGDGSWNVNFDGLQNTTGTMTLAKSGVTAGSYNSVTVDAKGRVIRGLNQTHGLVTATTATGTANVATGNGNTFLNIVASGVGQTASVGSSTQVTGTNGITISSDTAGKLIVTRDSNSPTATKLATIRTLAITGDGTGQASFDGSANANIALTLTNSGVTAGSYNSVTVDAKGRVIRGLNQTHGLVTATTATGTANVATGNGNTFLNIVASGVGQTASVGSSTQVTGTNGISVSSDTAGKLILGQTLANNLTDTSTAKALTALQGKVLDEKITTINNILTSHRHNWNEIGGKPSTFAPSSHTHTIANITDYDVRQISTEDLDSITKWGIYGQGANNRSLTERNYPVPNEAGTLEVMPGTYGLRQRFTTYSTHRQFERSRNNAMTGWNAWIELSNTWEALRDKPNNLAYTSSNVATATKLQTARNIAMTGDGSWNVNFDGSQNATGALTLTNSGVTAGSYNSVTVDAKGRVIRGLNQTHGLVTATTATGTANVATGNGNTFLNIVASGVGQTASVGSSTQVTGTNGITISSDTAGKLIVTRDSNSPTATKLQTACTISLTGAVTGRVNFDGSRNVSMATTLTKATVRDFNRIISGTATALGRTTNNIKMTGQVVVSADGLIRQYFHLKHFRDWWFGRDDNAIGYQNHDIATYKIPIALWTAMPNKVLSVQAQTMRSSDTASSAQFSSEAAEHEVAWAFRNQGIDKSNVWLNLSRTHGSASEHIDLFVIVEGY